MSTAEALGHEGNWTLDDMAALPEDGRRYEIVDGALHVTPAPGSRHQIGAARLGRLLEAAAPPELEVLEGVGIQCGTSMLIPDISVVDAQVAVDGVTVFKPADVRLVIEIVSPSSTNMDCVIKPAIYASAGIPAYWYVELGPDYRRPAVVLHELDGDRYVETCILWAGERLELDYPFPVILEPAKLVGMRP